MFDKLFNSYIVETYINYAGMDLGRFTKKRDNLWNFICPFPNCAELATDKREMKAFIHLDQSGSDYIISCRKCGRAHNFVHWVKENNNSLYRDMLREAFTNKRREDSESIERDKKEVLDSTLTQESSSMMDRFAKRLDNPTPEEPKPDISDNPLFAQFKAMTGNSEKKAPVKLDKECFYIAPPLKEEDLDDFEPFKNDIFHNAIRMDTLTDKHGAYRYTKKRLIPYQYFSKLYFVPKFMTWVNSFKNGKFKSYALKYDEPRLVIPFYNEKGECFAIQGRSFKKGDTDENGNKILRYITIKNIEKNPKVYGLEEINHDSIVKVVEGPIDSMFLANTIAMAGADVNLDELIDDYVMIYDNEPRAKQMIDRLHSDIDKGKKVVIWPSYIAEKDINEMVRDGGYTPEELEDIIEANTFKGLKAKLKLAEVSKVR